MCSEISKALIGKQIDDSSVYKLKHFQYPLGYAMLIGIDLIILYFNRLATVPLGTG